VRHLLAHHIALSMRTVRFSGAGQAWIYSNQGARLLAETFAANGRRASSAPTNLREAVFERLEWHLGDDRGRGRWPGRRGVEVADSAVCRVELLRHGWVGADMTPGTHRRAFRVWPAGCRGRHPTAQRWWGWLEIRERKSPALDRVGELGSTSALRSIGHFMWVDPASGPGPW